MINQRSTPINILALLGWIALCCAAAVPGAFWPPGEWFASLAKPWWNPPGWIFGPVWSLLYLTMGCAAWRVWRASGWGRARGALGLFLLQLALNALWTPVFFGAHQPGLAFGVIIALWLAIAVTIRAFVSHDQLASTLLIPYLLWVSFASALNLAIWAAN